MPWAFSDIQTEVRQLTGRLSPNSLSNNRLNFYINNYVQFKFPAEVKLERVHSYYEFNTSPNVQSYTFPNELYTNVEPPLYLDGMPLVWYQEPTQFFQQNPIQINRYTLGTGDGVTVAFSTTIQQPPIVPGTAIVTDNVSTFLDTNTTWTESNVNLSGPGTGTINYETGAVNVTFTTAPESGANVVFSWEGFTAYKPNAVLLYNNVFRFAPIPDTVYRARIKAYSIQSVVTTGGTLQTYFVNSTDTPLLEEWGPAISLGSARDVVRSFGEFDRYKELTALYKEEINYCLTRTEQNLLNTRAMPMW